MNPMRSMSHRKTIQGNHSLLPNSQLNLPFRHYDLASEILGVFGRLQKNNRKGYGISRRNFKAFERLEALQMRNIFRRHAADDFRRNGIADPNRLALELLTSLVVNSAGELNFANDHGILIERHPGDHENLAVTLDGLISCLE